MDSARLNYSVRVSYTASEAPGIFPLTLWEYYAIAESPLTSDNITVHSTRSPSLLTPILAFAVHPGDDEKIFNPNPSLPIAKTCPGLNPTTVSYQSCSASIGRLAQSFVISITAINDAPPCPPSSGFSELAFDGGTLDIQYRIVGKSQSNVTFTCAGGMVNPLTDPMVMVLDAVSLHGQTSAVALAA
jgi:hypothetical protein